MILRRERLANPQEIAELIKPPVRRVPHAAAGLGAALGWGVPGLLLAIIVVALAMNLSLLPGSSRVVLIVLMAITGVIAAAFLLRASWRLYRAIAGPPRPAPPMTEADAAKVRFSDVTIRIDEAWRLDIGDDDVPWYLFRCGERYVSLYTGIADNLFEDEQSDQVGQDATITLIGAVVWNASSRGPRVPVTLIEPSFDAQAQSLDWPLQAFAVIDATDLWDDLAARMGIDER